MIDPQARQLGILAKGFLRLESRRMMVGQVIGFMGLFLSPTLAGPRLLSPAEAVFWAVVGVAIYLALGIGIVEASRPARVRAAYESFLWIGRREYRRALAATGARKLPGNPDEMRRWLATVPAKPETASIRIEGLVWTGDFDGARALVETLPEWRQTERFDKALNRAFVEFVATGNGSLDEAHAAAAELRGDELLRARALLAIEAARQRVAAGDPDWIAPLVEVRPAIGRDADRLIQRDIVFRQLRGYALVGGALSAVLYGLGLVSFPSPPV